MEAEAGGTIQEETGKRGGYPRGWRTRFHQGSCREHLISRGASWAAVLSLTPRVTGNPLLSGLQLPHLEERMGDALPAPLALHHSTKGCSP